MIDLSSEFIIKYEQALCKRLHSFQQHVVLNNQHTWFLELVSSHACFSSGMMPDSIGRPAA